MKRNGIFALCFLIPLLFGCTGDPVSGTGGPGDPQENPGENQFFAVAKSTSVTRETAAVSQDLLTEQARGNNTFAVGMYKLLAEEGKNLFFSPYSITAALAMTAAGGIGDTKQQIRDALRVTLESDAFDRAVNAIDRSLMDHTASTEGITLNVVNSTWLQTGMNFHISYLDHLSRYYGAGVNLLDFSSKPEESRVIINTWVADRTNQKIKDLVPPGEITPLTVAVLTNAIYFLADWLYSFDPKLTVDKPFRLLDNSTVQVPLMQLNEPDSTVKMLYARENGVRALDFPYKGDRLTMTVLLPDSGSFTAFEDSLDLEIINGLVEALDSTDLAVSLPKFEFTFGTESLKNALKALGMTDAFGGKADFSGMLNVKPGEIYVSDVFHKAFISVDEKGTEAAAATAVIFTWRGISTDDPVFIVDRPFIYIIRDRVTGTILFMGRILNPTVSEN
ncbi:MAG: serpin family protein [Chitinispirillaceae bacterium]|nr:serpin family protein [Chitinispirillaceae bacterium]